MEHIANTVTVRGKLCAKPEISHENHGKIFYRFYLEIPRLSSTTDILPVIASEELMNATEITEGEMVTVTGQVRTHNIRSDGKRRLLIFIFATGIMFEDGEPLNDIVLEGTLCREPNFRKTPLGREICDIMLSVPRGYHRADYVPCILWGQTARNISKCTIGDQLRINGRLQSRAYTKVTEEGSVQKIAYEVSALHTEVLKDSYEGL